MSTEQLAQVLEKAHWRPHAERLAATDMAGYLTADEILAVRHRHPLWAPGAKYGPPLPSSPVRGILQRLRGYT